MMNKESLNTLVSYLEHLDYIKKHEDGKSEEAGKPPKIPDHLREKIYVKQNQESPTQEEVKNQETLV